MYIKLDDIIPNRFQPREVFEEEALNKLADSIRQHGVIEPIIVRPIANKYEIVAGERRYKASILAGLTKIPAIIKPMDDKESSIVAFIENEHRSDVSAIEEARTMDRILKNNDMTQEELAKELGMNQSTVANKLRLLNLPMEVQESLMRNEISERHARSLLSVKDVAKQKELLEKIKERKMTVRELDSEIKNMNEGMNNNFNTGMTNEPTFGGNSGFNPLPNFDLGANNNNNSNPTSGFDSMNYLNNFDSNPLPPINNEPVPPVAPAPSNDTGLPNFLNNYDNKFPLPEENPDGTTGGGNSYLNTNPEPTPGPSPVSDSGLDFLNNFNTNPAPINNEPVPPVAPASEQSAEDVSFMNFLNDYDNKFPLPPEGTPEGSSEGTPDGTDSGGNSYLNTNPEPSPVSDPGLDFLNNFNTNPLPPINNEPVVPPINNEPTFTAPEISTPNQSFINNDIYGGFNKPADNVTLNNVTPPITSNFNTQYIEDNANYVDVSKEQRINNVDEIINKLGNVVKEIKEKSIFKVDTEEINYDDIYQITIKIDKRDF